MRSGLADRVPLRVEEPITLIQLLEKNTRLKSIEYTLEKERRTFNGPIIVTARRLKADELDLIEEYNAIGLSQV